MTFQMILWLCIGFLPILMFFLLRNETRFKKNIVLGVTLPYDARKDGEVLSTLRKFKTGLTLVCAALLLLCVGGALVRDMSLSMTLWGMWVLLAVAAPYVPYVVSHLRLKRIKTQRGWSYARGQVITVDTSVIQPAKWLSPWLFLPPLLISLVPLVWERSFFAIYLVDALCVVLFWFCYRHLLRSRAERVDDNAELTKVLTQVRRRNWGSIWLLSAWGLALLSPVTALTATKPLLMSVLFAVLTLALIAFAMGIEFRLRHVQEKLTSSSGHGSYVDEDDKWIWGLFYYDRNDKKLIVNNRVGSNTTVNIARPAGKVLMVFVAVLLLAIPFIFPIAGAVSDGAVVLEIREDVLAAGGKQYELALEDIAQAELLDTLPKGLARVAGTALPNLLRGGFSAPETGKVKVSLDPTCGPFLLVTMQSGQKYLLGSRTPGAVEAVFAELRG